MKRIAQLIVCIAALAMAATPVAIVGCKTPQQAAYQSADAVISSVDVAMRAWADYVVAERAAIRALPPAERGSRESDLLRREGRVVIAYGRYQDAMRVSEASVAAAIGDGKALPQNVGASAVELVNLIRSLTNE